MKKRIRLICAVLTVIMLSGILSACDVEDPSETTGSGVTTLWIVTEAEINPDGGMNVQAEAVIREFEKNHENVEIELEILPHWKNNREEREVRLEQIRAEILAGKGPDGYLLPNYFLIAEPMFNDVQQAMRNGVFTDISACYDADDTLGKENLVTEVMDAGVVDGARYVLPLRYTFPVAFVDTQIMEEAGIDLRAEDLNIYSLWDEISKTGDQAWYIQAAVYSGAVVTYLTYLPEALDYDTGEVLIDKEELAAFLYRLQDIKQNAGENIRQSITAYLYTDTGVFFSPEAPMEIYQAERAMEIEAIAQVEGRDVAAMPLRAADGDLVAEVTYYGAVGSGSQEPELVYEFLREFLTEESQFEHDRLSKPLKRIEHQLIAGGLPVRMKGSVEKVWDIYQTVYQNLPAFGNNRKAITRRAAVLKAEITAEDVPVLDVPIDRVHFASTVDQYDLSDLIAQLNDIRTGEPTDVDVEALAQEIIDMYRMHLGEG